MIKILDIINRIPNNYDSEFVRKFIIELCQRYIQKSEELDRYVNPTIEALDRRYMKTILQDFGVLKE